MTRFWLNVRPRRSLKRVMRRTADPSPAAMTRDRVPDSPASWFHGSAESHREYVVSTQKALESRKTMERKKPHVSFLESVWKKLG